MIIRTQEGATINAAHVATVRAEHGRLEFTMADGRLEIAAASLKGDEAEFLIDDLTVEWANGRHVWSAERALDQFRAGFYYETDLSCASGRALKKR